MNTYEFHALCILENGKRHCFHDSINSADIVEAVSQILVSAKRNVNGFKSIMSLIVDDCEVRYARNIQ